MAPFSILYTSRCSKVIRRAPAGKVMFQWFRFTAAFKGNPLYLFYKGIDFLHRRFICILPIEVIFPGLVEKDDLPYSTRRLSCPKPFS
jgi:hypothetical protein